MSVKLLKKILESECNRFYLKNRQEIIDIILFGSFEREKDKPNDIDILMLFKEKKNLETSYQLKKILEREMKIKIEVTPVTYAGLFDINLKIRESFLTEGYSLIQKKGIAAGLGFVNRLMFIYNLKGKSKSQRMLFYYSLYGRNSEGMLKKLNAVKFADTIILCSIGKSEEMRAFFHEWQIEFKEVPLLIPERLES